MSTTLEESTLQRPSPAIAWLPLLILPPVVLLVSGDWPPWVFMWALAYAIFISLKWLTLTTCDASLRLSSRRTVAYLLLWPGMKASIVATTSPKVCPPSIAEWRNACVKMTLGGALVFASLLFKDQQAVLAAWTAMVGLTLLLHCGGFHLLSCVWRSWGIDTRPIMNSPLYAASLSDFWGRRWNLAFRDLAHELVFRPLVGRFGVTVATLAVFLVSGLTHDLVISIPAGGGYGGPTIYFLIQGIALLFERSRPGKQLGLGNRWPGRIFCVLTVLGPVGLLFHPAFLESVMLPMLSAIATFCEGILP